MGKFGKIEECMSVRAKVRRGEVSPFSVLSKWMLEKKDKKPVISIDELEPDFVIYGGDLEKGASSRGDNELYYSQEEIERILGPDYPKENLLTLKYHKEAYGKKDVVVKLDKFGERIYTVDNDDGGWLCYSRYSRIWSQCLINVDDLYSEFESFGLVIGKRDELDSPMPAGEFDIYYRNIIFNEIYGEYKRRSIVGCNKTIKGICSSSYFMLDLGNGLYKYFDANIDDVCAYCYLTGGKFQPDKITTVGYISKNDSLDGGEWIIFRERDRKEFYLNMGTKNNRFIENSNGEKILVDAMGFSDEFLSALINGLKVRGIVEGSSKVIAPVINPTGPNRGSLELKPNI